MSKRNSRLRMFAKIDKTGRLVAQTNIYRLKRPGGNRGGWVEIYPDQCCTTTTTTSTSTTSTTT